MSAESSKALTSYVMSAEDLSFTVSRQNQRFCRMQVKAENLIFVIGKFMLAISDGVFTSPIGWVPKFHSLIVGGTDNSLATVFSCESSTNDIALVPRELLHNCAFCSVNEPDHKIFASRHEYRCSWVPLNEQHVLNWHFFNKLLKSEAIGHIPNPQLIVHASGDHIFSRSVKLTEFYCLSVTL